MVSVCRDSRNEYERLKRVSTTLFWSRFMFVKRLASAGNRPCKEPKPPACLVFFLQPATSENPEHDRAPAGSRIGSTRCPLRSVTKRTVRNSTFGSLAECGAWHRPRWMAPTHNGGWHHDQRADRHHTNRRRHKPPIRRARTKEAREKRSVFRGLAESFADMQSAGMGPTGLEPVTSRM